MKNDPPFELGQVRTIEVIEVQTCRGKGIENDPMRNVRTYWTLEGVFLAEYDTLDYIPTAVGKGAAP